LQENVERRRRTFNEKSLEIHACAEPSPCTCKHASGEIGIVVEFFNGCDKAVSKGVVYRIHLVGPIQRD
jgi:hypothetical protein